MRDVILFGLDDKIRCELGSDTGLIGAVMEIGRYIPDLIYKAVMKGDKMIEFLKEYKVKDEILTKINPENEYELTAYDW